MSTLPTDPRRPSTSPVEALRRRWWLAAVLPLALGAGGYAAGLAKPPVYTAEARVAVGAGSLTSGAIAGFPEAAATMAANYSRYVNSSGVTTTDLSTEGVELSASPIPESYIIRIEGQGGDADTVVAGTQKAADHLVQTVNSGKGADDAAKTLAEYKSFSAKWAKAKSEVDAAASIVGRFQGKPGEAKARAVLAAAQARAADLQIQMDALGQKYTNQVAQSSTDADLTIARRAEIVTSSKSSTAQKFLLAGLVLGGLLALALAWLLARLADRRRPAAHPVREPQRAHAAPRTAEASRAYVGRSDAGDRTGATAHREAGGPDPR